MSSILPYEPYTGENVPLPAVPQMGQIIATQPQPQPQQPVEQPGFFSNLMGKLQNDPAANMALIMAGARMMQGQRPGQTVGGSLADAIMMGAMGHEGVVENQRNVERQNQEMKMRQDESAALVESRNATTESTKQQTKFAAEKQPMELDKLKNQAKEATLKLRIAELDSVVKEAEGRADPTGAERAKAAKKLAEAELARVQAQTAASNASAANSRASAEEHEVRTGAERNKVWAQGVLQNPSATQEQKDSATLVLTGGKSATAAKKDEHTLLKNLYKEAHPGATDSEAAQYALDSATSAKGDNLRAAIAVMNSETPGSIEHGKAKDLVMHYISKANTGNKTAASNDLETRFNNDQAMKGNKLGTELPTGGRQVLNASGKVIGTYK